MYEGHGFHGTPGQVSRAVKATAMRALAPEVRLWGIPDEIGHLSRHVKALRAGSHKEIRQKFLKDRTSGAERIPRGKTAVLPSVAAADALSDRILYGTAEAVPFVH